MNDQERQVISDIFRRLEQVANQPRDPEAERFIADKVRQQPYAPYAMAQALFVQEQALERFQAEVEQLRAELEQARQQPQQGGFLSGLFGGSARPPEPGYHDAPRQASPWGNPNAQPMPPSYGMPQGGMMGGMGGGPWGGGMMPSRGGGFLQGALSTAAGVAGGVMIANALSHAFGGSEHAGQGALDNSAGLGGLAGQSSSGDDSTAGITDALYQNPQDNQNDQEDYGPDSDFDSDGGDGGDWT